MDNNYHAGGNACMHQHHKAFVQIFSGQTGHLQIPIDMVLQNCQFSSWQTRQTAWIAPLDCQSQDTGHMDPLLRQRAWTDCARNARPSEGNGHKLFILKDRVPRARAKDITYSLVTCLIRPQKIEELQQNKISGRRRQGKLPIWRRHANRWPTYHQVTHS